MLINKYRPKTFDEVVGNETTIESLRKVSSHAILLWGQSGCGKTTLARIIASQLNAVVREENSANKTGIDDIRGIIDDVRTRPLGKDNWVVILDECHQISTQGQQALLKEIEEPPSHVYYILCSTEPNKIIKTLMNRLTKFEVSPLSKKEAIKFATNVWEQEGKPKQGEWEKVIVGICNQSEGVPREILTYIDSINTLDLKKVEKILLSGTEDTKNVFHIVKLLEGRWETLAEFMDELEDSPYKIRILLINYYTKALRSNGSYGNKLKFLIDMKMEFPKQELLYTLWRIKND